MTNSCIEHSVCADEHGYGRVRRGGRNYLAHRLAYCEAHSVPIESIAGLVVRHTCDNPRCINPEHLLIGTQADNCHDAVVRKRRKTGERHHKAVLSNAQAEDIKRMYIPRHPEYGTRALARRYGVAQGTISYIVRNLRGE